jgi:dethiobiotin synthetase
MVVEGAGGILAPIANREYGAEDTEVGSHGSGVRSRDGASTTYFMADLIRDLQLPAVIVTRPALGTINHTLMSVREALRGGITVAGVVINYCSPAQNTIAERTNPEILRELCPVPILGIVPHLPAVSLQMIEEIAAPCIDLTL